MQTTDITRKAKDIEVETEESLPEYPYGVEQQSGGKKRKKKKHDDMEQLSLFDTSNTNIKMDDIILELHDLDLSATTPIDAMNILYRMQMKLRERM